MNEHFTLELFQAINDWQAYAIGKKINGEYISLKKKLGDKLNILTKNLPKKFKTYGGERYRKFNSSDNYKLGLGEFIKEEYSAWTIDFNIAQDDNFLRNANQQQRGIIFKKSICNEGDIILNLNELYQDKDFCTAIDLYKDNIKNFNKGMGKYKNSQKEIIMKQTKLTLNDIVAYYGKGNSNKNDFMEKYNLNRNERRTLEKRPDLLKKMSAKQWVTDESSLDNIKNKQKWIAEIFQEINSNSTLISNYNRQNVRDYINQNSNF